MWRGWRNGAVCRAASSAELEVTVDKRMSPARANSSDDPTSVVPLSEARAWMLRTEAGRLGVDVEGDEPIDAGLAQAAGDRGARFAEADEADRGIIVECRNVAGWARAVWWHRCGN